MGENANSDILAWGGGGGGGRGGKSSTVTTGHVTASYNWFENNPKILLWHSEAKNQ